MVQLPEQRREADWEQEILLIPEVKRDILHVLDIPRGESLTLKLYIFKHRSPLVYIKEHDGPRAYSGLIDMDGRKLRYDSRLSDSNVRLAQGYIKNKNNRQKIIEIVNIFYGPEPPAVKILRIQDIQLDFPVREYIGPKEYDDMMDTITKKCQESASNLTGGTAETAPPVIETPVESQKQTAPTEETNDGIKGMQTPDNAEEYPILIQEINREGLFSGKTEDGKYILASGKTDRGIIKWIFDRSGYEDSLTADLYMRHIQTKNLPTTIVRYISDCRHEEKP
jgi:hypothetical protein